MQDLTTRRVAVLGGTRIPFCRIGTTYDKYTAPDLLNITMNAIVERFGLKGVKLGDVSLGTTFYPPIVWNMAREAVLNSGLHPDTPAFGAQRACGTGLEAACLIASKIALGKIDSGIAGGTESASDMTVFLKPGLAKRVLRMGQAKNFSAKLSAWKGISLNDVGVRVTPFYEPTTGKTMGQHCEEMAKTWNIDRKSQDELALESHRRGWAAYERGFYKDLVHAWDGVERDNTLRKDTTMEKMAKLSPVFDRSEKGTLTAANSSPLTDGAACALLSTDEWAQNRGLPVLAYLRDFEASAVDIKQEGLLMAPAYAVPRMLARNGLKLQDFDFYEIHEAFAAQVLCTLKAWESADYCKKRLGLNAALGSIDRSKLNVAGGSVAMGHPFGATGARILATAAKLLAEKGSGRALISICTGGGMGTVAILEK